MNDHVNLSVIDLSQWENNRVQTAYSRPRYVTAKLDVFSFRGETLEGVRVANLWGTENPFTHDLVK